MTALDSFNFHSKPLHFYSSDANLGSLSALRSRRQQDLEYSRPECLTGFHSFDQVRCLLIFVGAHRLSSRDLYWAWEGRWAPDCAHIRFTSEADLSALFRPLSRRGTIRNLGARNLGVLAGAAEYPHARIIWRCKGISVFMYETNSERIIWWAKREALKPPFSPAPEPQRSATQPQNTAVASFAGFLSYSSPRSQQILHLAFLYQKSTLKYLVKIQKVRTVAHTLYYN